MKAIQFVGEGHCRLVDSPEPTEPPNDGVIVDVAAVRICGTDLRILTSPIRHDAKPGIVLGHEIAGVVAAARSDVTSVSEGDHVAIDPAKNCGLCPLL
jgi:threonine dehydrogenase-like Zn-dependent dehydrogenase